MLPRHCELASVKKFRTGDHTDQPTITKPQNHQNKEIGRSATTINQI